MQKSPRPKCTRRNAGDPAAGPAHNRAFNCKNTIHTRYTGRKLRLSTGRAAGFRASRPLVLWDRHTAITMAARSAAVRGDGTAGNAAWGNSRAPAAGQRPSPRQHAGPLETGQVVGRIWPRCRCAELSRHADRRNTAVTDPWPVVSRCAR